MKVYLRIVSIVVVMCLVLSVMNVGVLAEDLNGIDSDTAIAGDGDQAEESFDKEEGQPEDGDAETDEGAIEEGNEELEEGNEELDSSDADDGEADSSQEETDEDENEIDEEQDEKEDLLDEEEALLEEEQELLEEAEILSYAAPINDGKTYVYNFKELKEWIEDEVDVSIGGEVYLGDNITIDESINVGYNISSDIIINTGEYGIIIDGGEVSGNSLQITGEGVNVPVVEVRSIARMTYWPPPAGLKARHWNGGIGFKKITATGNGDTGNGDTGGTALYISEKPEMDDYTDKHSSFTDRFVSVESYGEGAVGIEINYEVSAFCLDVNVEGEDSVGILAPYGAEIFYSVVNAEGNGALSISGGGELLLDTCVYTQVPGNAKTINRKILAAVGSSFYFPIRQGRDILNEVYSIYAGTFFSDKRSFILSGDDEFSAFRIDDMQINPEMFLGQVDTSVIGKKVIKTELDSAYLGLGLEDEISIDLTVDVKEEDSMGIPFIHFIENQKYARICYWGKYENQVENLIFWCSDDSGESWFDITDSELVTWEFDEYNENGDSFEFLYGVKGMSYVTYDYSELEGTLWFQLEDIEGNESQIVTISEVDDYVLQGDGGDRDGGDRKIKDPNKQPGDDGEDGNESGEGNEPDGEDGNESGEGNEPDGEEGNESGEGNEPDGEGGNESGEGNEPDGEGGNESGEGNEPDGEEGNESGEGNEPDGEDGNESGEGNESSGGNEPGGSNGGGTGNSNKPGGGENESVGGSNSIKPADSSKSSSIESPVKKYKNQIDGSTALQLEEGNDMQEVSNLFENTENKEQLEDLNVENENSASAQFDNEFYQANGTNAVGDLKNISLPQEATAFVENTVEITEETESQYDMNITYNDKPDRPEVSDNTNNSIAAEIEENPLIEEKSKRGDIEMAVTAVALSSGLLLFGGYFIKTRFKVKI